MTLKEKIPSQFYSLFRTKNMDYYILFLVSIYDENNDVYTSLGLTVPDCRQIVLEQINKNKIDWVEDASELETDEQSDMGMGLSPTTIITRLINWGWLRSDFDDELNEYIISFPEYSQMYVELFKELLMDDNDRERESILSIYSALYTYYSDNEKNNDILKHALKGTRGLGQLLSNMQDGMRNYFDELSKMKEFLGIQEVLIKELNNSDSKKYAILTTTDSFYRYKESIKELVSKILEDNDLKKIDLERKSHMYEEGTRQKLKNNRMLTYCDEAGALVYRIEREFVIIERKYNKLIDQKTVFAKRALARIHYIMQGGASGVDNTLKLVAMIDKSRKKDEILKSLEKRMKFTTQYTTITTSSMYVRKEAVEHEFIPVAVSKEASTDIHDYVPKPLYTKKELDAFRMKHTKDNGEFIATGENIKDIYDLEKLMFLWNDVINDESNKDEVNIEEDVVNQSGFTFSKIRIRGEK